MTDPLPPIGSVPFGRALGTHALGKFVRHAPDVEPADPGERFEWRVAQMMNATGRDRTWCIDKCGRQFPDERDAHMRGRGS